MRLNPPWLRPALTYLLPPLNLALFTLLCLILHATLHPTTSAPSYYLRSHGYHPFQILTLTTLTVCGIVGAFNAYLLYTLLTRPSVIRTLSIHLPHPRNAIKMHYILVPLAMGAAAAYLLIVGTVFTEPFREMAWAGTCTGYELMTEVEVLPGWYDGTNTTVFGPSSRITMWRAGSGEKVGMWEVRRHYRMEPGFNLYRRGAPERERFDKLEGWGVLDVRLVLDGGRYWGSGNTTGAAKGGAGVGGTLNGTAVVEGGVVEGGVGNGTVGGKGRVGAVKLDLKSSTYAITYTNASTPALTGPYDILPTNLTFPGLHLLHAQPGRQWRFTDHVCLPPRVALASPDRNGGTVEDGVVVGAAGKDGRGELGDGCVRYRMCALKRGYRVDAGEEEGEGEGEGWQAWWGWVEDVWPVVAGVVAWEVEKWSACCLRGE